VKATPQIIARIELANQIMRVIASHGRRFFSQDADHREQMENPRISRFELADNGYLYYIDNHRGSRLFAHYEPRGRGGLHSYRFSDGGTLLCLVQNLRDFILHCKPIRNHFGPWRKELCGGDLWGYGFEEAEAMRKDLEPLLAQAEKEYPC
jgi:hypothetical protein